MVRKKYSVYSILSLTFSNDKIKAVFTPSKYDQLSKYWFTSCVVIFDWCFFQLIVLMNADFDCCSGFALSGIELQLES